MQRLTVNNVSYSGKIGTHKNSPFDTLKNFSYEFEFGKSYLLDVPLGQGAWALCYLIGGKLKVVTGEIMIDDNLLDEKNRQSLSWFIRYSEADRFRGLHRSLKWHIRKGLKKDKGQYLKTEDELKQAFNLTPARYTRKIRQFSNEGWRASCAVGMANGAKIFLFPHLEWIGTHIIKEGRTLWLEKTIDILKDSGAIVLMPAPLNEYSQDLCDEVVNFTNN